MKRIGFCGTFGVGKASAAQYLLDNWKGEERPFLISSPIPEIQKWDSDWHLMPDQVQLNAVFLRKSWILPRRSVISEGTALDQAAYQKQRFDSIIREAQAPSLIVASQTDHSAKEAEFVQAQAAFQVCLTEAAWEVENYWDYIYYLSPYGQPADGINQKYQLEIDECIRFCIDVLKPLTMKLGNAKIIQLPTDQKEAQEFLQKELEQWA